MVSYDKLGPVPENKNGYDRVQVQAPEKKFSIPFASGNELFGCHWLGNMQSGRFHRATNGNIPSGRFPMPTEEYS